MLTREKIFHCDFISAICVLNKSIDFKTFLQSLHRASNLDTAKIV